MQSIAEILELLLTEADTRLRELERAALASNAPQDQERYLRHAIRVGAMDEVARLLRERSYLAILDRLAGTELVASYDSIQSLIRRIERELIGGLWKGKQGREFRKLPSVIVNPSNGDPVATTKGNKVPSGWRGHQVSVNPTKLPRPLTTRQSKAAWQRVKQLAHTMADERVVNAALINIGQAVFRHLQRLWVLRSQRLSLGQALVHQLEDIADFGEELFSQIRVLRQDSAAAVRSVSSMAITDHEDTDAVRRVIDGLREIFERYIDQFTEFGDYILPLVGWPPVGWAQRMLDLLRRQILTPSMIRNFGSWAEWLRSGEEEEVGIPTAVKTRIAAEIDQLVNDYAEALPDAPNVQGMRTAYTREFGTRARGH